VTRLKVEVTNEKDGTVIDSLSCRLAKQLAKYFRVNGADARASLNIVIIDREPKGFFVLSIPKSLFTATIHVVAGILPKVPITLSWNHLGAKCLNL